MTSNKQIAFIQWRSGKAVAYERIVKIDLPHGNAWQLNTSEGRAYLNP